MFDFVVEIFYISWQFLLTILTLFCQQFFYVGNFLPVWQSWRQFCDPNFNQMNMLDLFYFFFKLPISMFIPGWNWNRTNDLELPSYLQSNGTHVDPLLPWKELSSCTQCPTVSDGHSVDVTGSSDVKYFLLWMLNIFWKDKGALWKSFPPDQKNTYQPTYSEKCMFMRTMQVGNLAKNVKIKEIYQKIWWLGPLFPRCHDLQVFANFLLTKTAWICYHRKK